MFAALATLISRRPRIVLLTWLSLTLLALPFAGRVGEVLSAEASVVPGSAAAQVERLLSDEFSGQDQNLLVLVARAERAEVGESAFDNAFETLAADLRALPGVENIQDYRNAGDLSLVAPDRSYARALGARTTGWSSRWVQIRNPAPCTQAPRPSISTRLR